MGMRPNERLKNQKATVHGTWGGVERDTLREAQASHRAEAMTRGRPSSFREKSPPEGRLSFEIRPLPFSHLS